MYPPYAVTLPLDTSLYKLQEDDANFLKHQTGIQDDDALRDHVLQVQAEAYAIYPYPCIRRFGFTSFKIHRYPDYQAVLELAKTRPGAIFLELACCFGNDTRKAIADGFPLENVITSDIQAEFWDLGHKLYKTTEETYPVPFLAGDVFDPAFLFPDASPAPTSMVPTGLPPSLAALTSLTPLQHHVSIIHTASFFHLFPQAKQRSLAYLLATLLSPLPGSIILGSHMGLPDTEENKAGGTRWTGRGTTVFADSPTSWNDMWVGKDGVFKPEEVTVSTMVKEIQRDDIVKAGGDPDSRAYWLVWSITRV
ncbi:hypothetical protein K439DRAFT_1360580 [Ramaria rubella]|nr:hypothetical protein K439DRAFT_1360580 [Ramaria rubella]